MLVGCNKAVTPTGAEQKKVNPEIGTTEQPEQPDQSNRPSNYVKTYEDETHKKIQYGKMSLSLDFDHIVSDTRSDNTETFKCESDKGEVHPKTMTITVQAIKKQDFLNTENIISYLRNMSPNYEKIMIYNNVTDDSGIISSYSVTGDRLTNYVVCYRDACYLMESDNSNLDAWLFFQKCN